MALKNIPDPGFSDDDGTAHPALAAALAGYVRARAAQAPGRNTSDGTLTEADAAVVAALHGARLLVPVVAVLGEAETGEDGLRREKSSDMAVPVIQAPDGRRALPAFTSVDSLARWRADARPVAVPLHQALQALAHEKAGTLLIDMAGPVTYELTGAALRAAALGPERQDPLADPAVREALRAAVAAEPGVARAHLVAGQPGSDGTLGLELAPGADVEATGRGIAAALAGDEVLRGALLQGLDLALLPPGAAVPGDPLFSR
ncbi:SseB family protein [Actinacidiphila acidipaludis]|uniref:SseB family protein n=1 Tax=Actinacidiphila acidipaludis TaxID=2873382 RepID=A0ABS7QH83_9ACTN|nr:SseB family protein [Streptomyces acidipaludis]MBY8882531.1 SseB family protein [Streptomyces acidipaludis]